VMYQKDVKATVLWPARPTGFESIFFGEAYGL
jgi:hypothetical protein